MDDLCKSSMKFFSDQQIRYAEILLPHEVQARIQVAVLNFLKVLASPDPAISNITLIKRKSSNSKVSEGILTDVSWIFLSQYFCTRSLTRANAAKAFIRVWKVMEMCFEILIQEKRVTQRELFYKLLCNSPDYFSSQLQVNRTIQDVVALLRCSRYSLGIMASSRGLVAGLQEPNQEAVDCSACGSSGYAISGDLKLLESLIMKTDARYIIVVEKRLAEDHVFNQIPSILLTAKGYPDIATRFLLHRMSRAFPELPILALVDWNPAGLAILSTYKFGSIGMGLEAYRYACNVKWLGLRGNDLHLIPEQSLAQLKPRDLQIARSLVSSPILQARTGTDDAEWSESRDRSSVFPWLRLFSYDHKTESAVKLKKPKTIQEKTTENPFSAYIMISTAMATHFYCCLPIPQKPTTRTVYNNILVASSSPSSSTLRDSISPAATAVAAVTGRGVVLGILVQVSH
ncbi:Meiotic recombination protein SPO11-2 [Hibiscus syriacus]|uniref:DNA topoisomerase (ATP-hydrolyzing) n=1 Tax=Hibiscus syriacus TaxID=106335 RepID=A0A6A3B558_HIBSY|nr:Meiotic recombination protein SPO11-2 [Hibiscus syriacus]